MSHWLGYIHSREPRCTQLNSLFKSLTRSCSICDSDKTTNQNEESSYVNQEGIEKRGTLATHYDACSVVVASGGGAAGEEAGAGGMAHGGNDIPHGRGGGGMIMV